MRALYRAGADPADILIELAEFCHYVTQVKIAPDAPDDATISESEREKGREFAGRLSMGALTRAWQILLKGFDDVNDSPRPLASAEMALIRLAYASDLPTPEEALRKLAETTDYAPRHAPPLPPAGAGARASAARRPRRRSASSPSRAPPRPATAPAARGGPAGAVRGRRRARAGEARHPARPGARTRRAPRPVRAGQHRLLAGRGRVARPRADAGEAPAGMDRRTLDGGARAGLDRADPARGRRAPARPSGRPARRPIRWCARCSSASRARASSRCARREAAAAPAASPPQPDDDVGYADSDPVDDDDL